MPEFTLLNVFLNLAQAHEGTIGRQHLVVLNNLISSLVDHTRETLNDLHSHFDNSADSV